MSITEKLCEVLDEALVDEDLKEEIMEILRNHIGDYEGGMKAIYDLLLPIVEIKKGDHPK